MFVTTFLIVWNGFHGVFFCLVVVFGAFFVVWGLVLGFSIFFGGCVTIVGL